MVNRHTDRERRNIYLQFLENLKGKGFQYEVGQLRAGAAGCRVGPGQVSGKVACGFAPR